MAKLTSDARDKLKSSSFALPGSRKFPIPDKSHARNALARASQGVKAGTLSPNAAALVRAKARKKLGKGHPGGVDQDLNLARNQADQNNWKSRPVQQPPSFKSNSQSNAPAADSGQGTNVKKQPKFGGTVAPSADKRAVSKKGGTDETGKNFRSVSKTGGTVESGKSFKGQSKVQGATQSDGRSYKGQSRTGGTAVSGKNFKSENRLGGTGVTSRAPDGSTGGGRNFTTAPDHDGGMKSMIRNR